MGHQLQNRGNLLPLNPNLKIHPEISHSTKNHLYRPQQPPRTEFGLLDICQRFTTTELMQAFIVYQYAHKILIIIGNIYFKKV